MFALLNYSHCLLANGFLAKQPNSSKPNLDETKIKYAQQMKAKEEYKEKWESADEQEKSILEELQELEGE